jgi:hypothetical protein
VTRAEGSPRRNGIAGSNLRFNVCRHFDPESGSIQLLVLATTAADRSTTSALLFQLDEIRMVVRIGVQFPYSLRVERKYCVAKDGTMSRIPASAE